MKPFTSRQWKFVGHWATFGSIWNACFFCWFILSGAVTPCIIAGLFVVVCTLLTLIAFKREGEILSSLVCYNGEKIVQIAVRDSFDVVWTDDEVTDWHTIVERLNEDFGKHTRLIYEFGFKTTHRSFVTPEMAAFIVRRNGQMFEQPLEGDGLDPKALVAQGFRP